MTLQVIGSSSSGNCYLLTSSTGQTLILECGVVISKIKQALKFNLRNVVGCCVSHVHQDHSKAAKDLTAAGIPVFTSQGTIDAMGFKSHWLNRVEAHGTYLIGEFEIYAFPIIHDAPEPLCFIVRHSESGSILFLTDTCYCEFTFENINNFLIEANFCETIIHEKLIKGEINGFLRNRIYKSHMSLSTCKSMLLANDLSQVNNVVLIHLSDSNSDSARFKQEVENQTGKNVHIAQPGLIIPFSKTPF